MEKVFAVVVTFNGLRWLDRCIGSLLSSDVPVSVVVVDNASTDGTPERIAADFPDVHLIRSDINYGFAKANNIGIRYALDNGADYVFLLNQDAWIVEAHTIRTLISTFERNATAGIVSPIHMNGLNDSMDWKFATYMPGEFVSDAFLERVKEEYLTDYVNAAAWLVKRTCFEKVGGFDTKMFTHYGEDSNFCQRAIFHGWKIAICTNASICHDREFRRSFENEYRNANFSQKDINRRLEYANILYDVDVDSFISSNKTSLWKSYVKLKFKQASRIKEELEFLKQVKESRETNIKGGLNWL